MIHLITGGSASGKSEYAETQVLGCGGSRRIYIATMIPWDEETGQRIEKHRIMRREKQFETIECFQNLKHLTIPECVPSDTILLIECMSNLLANELYLENGTEQELLQRILEGIHHLQKQAESIMIVTNEVFSDGIDYEEYTSRYIRILGMLNQKLAAMADQVTEVICGIPVTLKNTKEEG